MKHELLSGDWYAYKFDCHWERIFKLADKIPLKVRKQFIKEARRKK